MQRIHEVGGDHVGVAASTIRAGITICLLMMASLAHAGELVVQVTDTEITACGATPGAEVLLLQVAWPERPWIPRVSTSYWFATDDDHDGCVTRVFDQAMPQATVAVAVDQRSGRFGSGSSASMVFTEEELSAAWMRNPAGQVHGFDIEARRIQVLVARPGESGSSWMATIGDGGASDADEAQNGRVRFRCSRARHLRGATEAFESLNQGDRVIALDTRARKIYYRKVGLPSGPPKGTGELGGGR